MTDSKRKESKGSSVWITLSFLLSGAILIWAFSLPFRQPEAAIIAEDGKSDTVDLAERIMERRSNAEEFREAAIALDQEFMRTYREKVGTRREVPGKREAKQHWRRHVTSVKRNLALLGDPERGTIEWQHQQELLDSLKDAPTE